MFKRRFICLMILVLGYATSTLANPRDYPEFAQHKVKDDIPIQFISPDMVKQHLDDGTPQVIIDVRSRASYDKRHLPDARSIPLRTLPERVAEVPHDVPVVLY